MFKLTIKSLRANAVRLVLSSLAIVLGVAFIAGTFVFTDGLKAASYEKVGKLDQKTSVGVALSETAYRNGTSDSRPGFDQATVDKVAALPGAKAAEGVIRVSGGLIGANGKPVPGYGMLSSIPTNKDLQSYEVTSGRLPEREGEIVVDTRTADKQGFKVGQQVKAGGDAGAGVSLTLVGIVNVEGTQIDFGGPFMGVTGSEVMKLSSTKKFEGMVVAAKPGVTDEALAKEVKGVVGDLGDVKTKQQLLDAGLAQVVGQVDQFNYVLLTFAAISAFVAAFVIANTFTIVLAQRARQTALLRLVGATRGQAFRSVVLESVVVGLTASAAGIVAGLGVAAGLEAILRKMGLPFEGGLVLTWQTVVICLVLGTVITVVSTLVPAWRGTRVAPVAALSDAAVETARKVGKVRIVFGGLILAAGVASLVFAGVLETFLFVGLGGVLTFTGIVMFGPVLVPALVRLLGWPLGKLFGATAKLATSNAIRNPRRIAATATAMVIGIGLVSAFQVGGESAKAGIVKSIDANIGADFMIQSSGGEVSQDVVDRLKKLPELRAVTEPRNRVENEILISSAHPEFVKPRKGKVVDGDPGKLAAGTAVVSEPTGKKVGDKVTVNGKSFEVVSVLKYPEVNKKPDTEKRYAITDADFTALYPESRPFEVNAALAPGVKLDKARDTVNTLLQDYPTLTLMDRAAYKQQLTSTVDVMLAFVTALLGLAVVISLIGVANTLTLSVVERTRENGVLRAVGLTSGRLRGMLAVEAVMMAVTGALLGVALGAAVSAGAVNFMNTLSGGDQFALVVPWLKLSVILGIAGLAALAASVLPARRAVNRPVVEALAAE
ncbi:ABC transporter permease [Longispora albida]|uniref:ABC transporter permease n=1 Tax=Longispora albida TaxID=203523 RepID=UPI00037C9ABA|nr:FtsX-like permease family protein [Longispora albida]